MRLRRRRVTVAPDVQQYIDSITPLYKNFATTWTSVLWWLEHKADEIGEELAGATRIAKLRLTRTQPVVTVIYKLSEFTVHVIDFKLSAGNQSGAASI